ncbi:MAG TPA: hypothetical protein VGM62_12255, partial [Chthoniobacterales bacterium]
MKPETLKGKQFQSSVGHFMSDTGVQSSKQTPNRVKAALPLTRSRGSLASSCSRTQFIRRGGTPNAERKEPNLD